MVFAMKSLLLIGITFFGPCLTHLVTHLVNEHSTPNVETAMHNGEKHVRRLQTLESRLSEFYKTNNEKQIGHIIESLPEKDLKDQSREAYIVSKATENLMSHYCTFDVRRSGKCVDKISKYSFKNIGIQGKTCVKLLSGCKKNDSEIIYRSYDGTCNVRKDNKGQAFTSYHRLLPADYLDGLHSIRRSVTKRVLMSPRVISVALSKDIPDLSNLTLAFMQWTEFIAHDLCHTVSSRTIHSNAQIECCGEAGWWLAPRDMHPFCLPIDVNTDQTKDPYYKQHDVNCLSYVRSALALQPGCKFGANQQVNQATHFLDGSQIYGSFSKRALGLREMKGGLLKINKKILTNSGDNRYNLHPHLRVMHTLFVREHNRLATILKLTNLNWTDEHLYQEARRIVIAEIQHITYNEWLPNLLGNEAATSLKNETFEEKVDPRVSNSFANAAIKFLKSLVDNKIKLYDEKRNVKQELRLSEHYNNVSIIEEIGYFDLFIRGLATQKSRKVDINYASDVTNNYFKMKDYGVDALSIDIQRGRDHGIPPYYKFRKLAGLKDAKNFSDFSDVMSPKSINSLTYAYEDPKDVDLIIGGLMEKPFNESLLGTTFSYIIYEQMQRTLKGDRYFYTNKNQPHSFTDEQLKSISNVKLAKIFCVNSDNIKKMQPNVFEPISKSNELTDCKKLPGIDIKYWKD